MLRMAAHLGIALQALEVIPPPDQGGHAALHDAMQRLLQTYIVHLMDTGQYDGIAMYSCFMRCVACALEASNSHSVGLRCAGGVCVVIVWVLRGKRACKAHVHVKRMCNAAQGGHAAHDAVHLPGRPGAQCRRGDVCSGVRAHGRDISQLEGR